MSDRELSIARWRLNEDDVERSIARWRAKLAEVEASSAEQVQCFYGPAVPHDSYCFCGGAGWISRAEAIADCQGILEALHK